MTGRLILAHALGLVLLVSSDVSADKYPAVPPPEPKLFASMSGTYGFKTLPDGSAGTSEGVLFALNERGEENVLWRARLVNIPGRVIVVESGRHVITLDSWRRRGFEHCLVVYGEKGGVLADFKLEDLLTAREIERLPAASTTIRDWSSIDIADFEDRSREDDEFVIRMKSRGWSKVIRVSLSNGQIVEASATQEKPPVDSTRPIAASHDRLRELGARISVVDGVVREVDLTNSTITNADMELIGALGSLERLILNGCANLSDPGIVPLQRLGHLRGLFLERTNITSAGLSNLSGLTELNQLSLNWTRTGDAGLKHLEGLTNLEVLYLCATDTEDGGLASIAKMGKLQWLDLRQTKVSDTGLPHLSHLPQLRLLSLHGVRMTDAGVPALAELSHLEGLTLSRTQVTDAGLEPLTRLSRLKELDLDGTQASQAGADRLQKLMPNCQVRFRHVEPIRVED